MDLLLYCTTLSGEKVLYCPLGSKCTSFINTFLTFRGLLPHIHSKGRRNEGLIKTQHGKKKKGKNKCQ